MTTKIGFIPEFSANVNGITSRASANALTHAYSAPFKVLEYSANLKAISISGTPPPDTTPL